MHKILITSLLLAAVPGVALAQEATTTKPGASSSSGATGSQEGANSVPADKEGSGKPATGNTAAPTAQPKSGDLPAKAKEDIGKK